MFVRYVPTITSIQRSIVRSFTSVAATLRGQLNKTAFIFGFLRIDRSLVS
jgi:hypothetical protein